MHHIYKKGVTMDPFEHSAKSLSSATGGFATLGGARGSGPSSAHGGGVCSLLGHLAVIAVAALCALAGALALTVAPALASSSLGTPEVTVEQPIHATTATFLGVLNPKATEPTEVGEYKFLYQPGASCTGGSETTPGMALGVADEVLPGESVAALIANTEYTVCLVEESVGGKVTSAPVHFTTALPPEAPEAEEAKPVTATTATLRGVLNPKARGNPGDYEFLYRQSGSECVGGSATASSASIGATPEPVSTELTGLIPATQYTLCLLARNEAGEEALGAPVTFTTLAVAPVIGEESVSDVAAAGATLAAQINPGGAETTYHFEYGPTASYGASLPVPDAELPSTGVADVPVSVRPQDLQPATVYHFRAVASNLLGTVDGPDQVFTTQAAGAELALPDGRQYEQVSPPEKHGAETRGIRGYDGGGIVQASENGEKITYITVEPPEANPPNNATATQLFSVRGPEGWSTQNISLAYVHQPGSRVGYGTDYRAFSLDLSRAVVEPKLGAAPLSKEAPEEGWPPLYLRGDTDGSYTPLFTSVQDVSPTASEQAIFEDATPDLGDIAFTAFAAMTGNAKPTPSSDIYGNLYEWSGGGLKLVNVLPPPGSETTVGEAAFYAISDDGSHIVWNYREGDEYPIYDRDTVTAETVQVNANQGGPSKHTESLFEAASADGSQVFFTSKFELTPEANTGSSPCNPECGRQGDDLYDYDVLNGKLADLTVDRNAGDEDGALAEGMLGVSEDGSYAYFVAQGGLAQGAISGTPNLYVAHYNGTSWEAPRFIATLSAQDESDWLEREQYEEHTSRVTSSGRFVAFESRASLTGYDNTDAETGQPDTEVYLYDADTGRLTCASCNPTGARPVAGAEIPTPTPMADVQAVYQSRYLSGEGRLFFDTTEALVPQDVNGRGDVYEYEPDGVGSCTLAGGCVYLISGGAGSQDSAFVDASASGGDVFFNTSEQLVPQDTDHAYDIYDAHVCTSAVPCLAAAPLTPPPCTNVDSCKPAPTPQPAIFGAPASATFSGLGNPSRSPTASGAKGKAKKRQKAKKRPKAKRRKRAKRRARRRGVRRSRAGGSSSGGARR